MPMSREGENPVSEAATEHPVARLAAMEQRDNAASGLNWKKAWQKAEGGGTLHNAALAEALKEKQEFTEEEWQAFNVGEVRMRHCINSGGSQFEPASASGLQWKMSKPQGDELINEQLSEALKVKEHFTQGEWQAFGIRDLHLKHFIRSGNLYFRPFEALNGFLPAASQAQERNICHMLTTKKARVLPEGSQRPQSQSLWTRPGCRACRKFAAKTAILAACFSVPLILLFLLIWEMLHAKYFDWIPIVASYLCAVSCLAFCSRCFSFCVSAQNEI